MCFSVMSLKVMFRRLCSEVEMAPFSVVSVRSWEECPGLVAQRTLPQCLQDYIATRAATGSAVLYIILALPHSVPSVPDDICCMVDCLMLENQFLMKLRKEHCDIYPLNSIFTIEV